MNNFFESLALGDLPLAQHIAKVFTLYVWEAGVNKYLSIYLSILFTLFTFKKSQ